MLLTGKKLGFSILEAIFAIAFLIVVGVGMQVLSNAALRLTDTAEIKTTVNAANGEFLAFIAGEVKLAIDATKRHELRLKIKDASFQSEGSDDCADPNKQADPCVYHTYFNCPTTPLYADCAFSKNPEPIQIGNKLAVVRLADISWPKLSPPNNTPDSLTVTVSAVGRWGGGSTKKESVSGRYVFK